MTDGRNSTSPNLPVKKLKDEQVDATTSFTSSTESGLNAPKKNDINNADMDSSNGKFVSNGFYLLFPFSRFVILCFYNIFLNGPWKKNRAAF